MIFTGLNRSFTAVIGQLAEQVREAVAPATVRACGTVAEALAAALSALLDEAKARLKEGGVENVFLRWGDGGRGWPAWSGSRRPNIRWK